MHPGRALRGSTIQTRDRFIDAGCNEPRRATDKDHSHVRHPEQPRARLPSARTANTDRVFIFDTTLRDGEQCPGATMTFEEKLEVADFLDEMGVDIIEAGFPIASEGDFQAVSEIAKRAQDGRWCAGCRAPARPTSTAPARP